MTIKRWKSINVSIELYLKLLETASKESIRRGKKISLNDVIKDIWRKNENR